MNKITYNDPNRTKERQEVEPLSDKEMQCLASDLRQGVIYEEDVQRLIDSYQNLQHFYDVAGGWDGLLKLQSQSGAPQTGDIEVNYEIVKDVNG